MSREVQAHLFEPFFTTKPRGIGTGLGLSTTYGILQQSGAHILVDSELGRGTAIDIYFPRIDEQAWEESPEPAPLMSCDKLGTLLLVEDDESVRVPIARTLRKVGYTVLEAAGGPEALQVAESLDGTIDLLVTDVVMPGMSGKDLADQLSTMRLGLKVLYISGYAGDVIGHQGVRDEGAQLLPKPFTVPDLLTRVAEVLNTGDGQHRGAD
jgi:CheY-like chemotaxis protein